MADSDSDSTGERFILTARRRLKWEEVSISEEEIEREWRWKDKRVQKIVNVLTITVHIAENANQNLRRKCYRMELLDTQQTACITIIIVLSTTD